MRVIRKKDKEQEMRVTCSTNVNMGHNVARDGENLLSTSFTRIKLHWDKGYDGMSN